MAVFIRSWNAGGSGSGAGGGGGGGGALAHEAIRTEQARTVKRATALGPRATAWASRVAIMTEVDEQNPASPSYLPGRPVYTSSVTGSIQLTEPL